MSAPQQLDDQLRVLREEFDHSFAVATVQVAAQQLDFVAIRVAGDPYLLRLSEVASLHADRRLVGAPSLLPELRGIAGFRGILTPVYDLGALLGYAPEPNSKWLVVAQWPSPIAFAFGAFEAHLRVPAERVSLANSEANSAVNGAVHDGNGAVPLLHLPSLVEGVLQRIKALGLSQER
ncbi:MAG TPA: chemotaxis protein CheW [Polyangiaceae bacterium]|jgi:chemotaxis signal transduction protein|nr:chemotaxis protein CheW [Polyangiaceae bacterium]